MKTSLIWKKLLINDQKLTNSNQIRKLAKKINKDEWGSIDYLQKHGFIYRIFKGIFYIKSPEERERRFFKLSIYNIIAMALKEKGVNNWYLALETALKFNNMTHEYFTVNYVITDSYRTTKIIKIINSEFQFLKWSKTHFDFGILCKNRLFYSDQEKTVLDMVYKKYLRNRNSENFDAPLIEYNELLDKEKLDLYIEHYPKKFQKLIWDLL